MTTSQPIEIAPVDIAAYRAGNTGVPYVTTFDSGRPGPHVMVNAVTHGNELCGAIAIDHLMRHEIKPLAGRLSLGFANVAAYLAFDAGNPSASRFVDEDFNRVWDVATLEGPRRSVELERARAMRGLVDTVDLLLDIHSMQQPTAPLMLSGLTQKALRLARQTAIPQMIVRDAGHAAGRRLRDYRGFGVEDAPQNALLVECGQHWAASSVEVALATTYRFLLATRTIDAATAGRFIDLAPPPAQIVVTVTDAVTIMSNTFEFAADFKGGECLPEPGTLIGHDGDRPVVTPYPNCILIMPSRRLSRGQTAVRLGRIDG